MKTTSKPYLLFLGDVTLKSDAKTAFGLRDWCPDDVVGEWAMPTATVSLGLPAMGPAEAKSRGAGSLVIGVASVGGSLPRAWEACLVEAAAAGLDIVSGMHTRLDSLEALARAAAKSGCRLINIRQVDGALPTGTGLKRAGKRLLTVGTDCALGKKYTALALTRAMLDKGAKATFRATGQTGILIAGAGIAIDAVIADFIAGAAEVLSPDNDVDHWDVVEGQGSLFHPAYAGVTLGLLHGSQPDAIVLCHDPSRLTIEGYAHMPMPSLRVAIDRYLEAGRLTNRDIRCVGLSINSSSQSDEEWHRYAARLQKELKLPVCDPMRGGVGAIADALLLE